MAIHQFETDIPIPLPVEADPVQAALNEFWQTEVISWDAELANIYARGDLECLHKVGGALLIYAVVPNRRGMGGSVAPMTLENRMMIDGERRWLPEEPIRIAGAVAESKTTPPRTITI
jgi:hypothetical protein